MKKTQTKAAEVAIPSKVLACRGNQVASSDTKNGLLWSPTKDWRLAGQPANPLPLNPGHTHGSPELKFYRQKQGAPPPPPQLEKQRGPHFFNRRKSIWHIRRLARAGCELHTPALGPDQSSSARGGPTPEARGWGCQL